MKRNNGVGFWATLQLMLIAFKLIGIIKWKWIAVFFPIYVILGFNLVVVLLAFYSVFVKKKED